MSLLRAPAVGNGAAVPDRRRVGVVVVALLAALLVGACGTATTSGPAPTATRPGEGTPAAPSPSGPIESLDDLRTTVREIGAAAPAAAQEAVDRLWDDLARSGRLPLTLGSDVVFLYRGAADAIHWRGSFNAWSEPGLAGSRVGQTNLWLGWTTLPPGSRIEYKVVRDGTEWLVDPANPATSYNGLRGVTSVLALPGFAVSDVSREVAGVASGRLEAGRSIVSRNLGETVEYWVYTPAGYEGMDGLPVLYLLDGNDFVDERMGAFPRVLDNLIATAQIPPLIAVFVDAREPGSPDRNRREDRFLARPIEHAKFIAEELVPAVDGAYRTDPDPDARAIAGVSFGGVSATFIAVAANGAFHNLAAFSPSLWVIDSPGSLSDEAKSAGARLMAERLAVVTACGGEAAPCPTIRIFLSGGLPDWDVGELAGLAGVLQQSGYPVEFHSVREGHTWDQWRGLSDEMLTFLFGAPAATRR